MELGKVERNQYGNEYVYIDFYGRTYKFRVGDLVEETEEIYQYQENDKDRTFVETKKILKLEQM